MAAILHQARTLAVAMVAVGPWSVGACANTLFVCGSDDDCAAAGSPGVCEAAGWCSFPDPECDGGRRYGEHAGDGLAGTCVVDDGGTTSSTTNVGSASTATLTDATGPTESTVATLEGGAETSAGESSAGSSESETAMGFCGDGQIDDGEACDEGDNGVGGACRSDCQLNVCGDGYLGPDEACDGTPDCNERCALPACGNGILEMGEECDPAMGEQTDCTTIGYVEGTYSCNRCLIDASTCVGCGPDGCSFGDCNDDRQCADGEQCVNLDNSFCTATCVSDADCPGDVPQACVDIEVVLCLPLCDVGDCPPGLTCYAQFDPPVCV